MLYWRAMLFATVVTIGMALSPSVWLLGLLAALRSIPVGLLEHRALRPRGPGPAA